MTPEKIYREWRKTLKQPNDSVFYYHPSLDRIILGLAIYDKASRPYLLKSNKIKMMSIYNKHIDEMVTAWIDESDAFEFPFTTLMTTSEAFGYACQGLLQKHPELKKTIRALQTTFFFWVGAAGDMNATTAVELLDDITTDGTRISSEKISQLLKRLQPTVISRGMDMTDQEAAELIGSL